MTIDRLNALATLTAADEFPVWDAEASGEPTKKITAQNFASSIKTLASLLGTGDVVNDLTSTDPTKVLAAPQGKALNDQIANKANKITKETKSITTNSNGVADLGMTQANGIIVALIIQDWIAIPFIVGVGRNWWAKVVGWSNMSVANAQTLSVDILYIAP